MKSLCRVLMFVWVAVFLFSSLSFAITKPEERFKDAVISGTFFYNGVPTAAHVSIIQLAKNSVPIAGTDKSKWVSDGKYSFSCKIGEKYRLYGFRALAKHSAGLGPQATKDLITLKNKSNIVNLEVWEKRTVIARAFMNGEPKAFTIRVYECDKNKKPISNIPEYKSDAMAYDSEYQFELAVNRNYLALAGCGSTKDQANNVLIPAMEMTKDFYLNAGTSAALIIDFNLDLGKPIPQ